MEKYIRIDGLNNVISIYEDQPIGENLPLVEITPEQYDNIFIYKLIGVTLQIDLLKYKDKKFKELNNKIVLKIMYIKNLKKIDDVKDLFVDEFKKVHVSLAEVDASIALIETDLFEV